MPDTKLKRAVVNSLRDHFINGGGFDLDEGTVEIEPVKDGVLIKLHETGPDDELGDVLEQHLIRTYQVGRKAKIT